MDKQKLSIVNDCIVGVKNRDQKSIDTLFDLVGSVIGYIAFKYLDAENAIDLVQDFWANIYQIADKFVYMTNGFAYLCKTMQRMALNRCKKLKCNKQRIVQYVDFSTLNYTDENSTIEDLNFKMTVEKAMEVLDDKEKIIMQLTIFEDKTIVQIAKELKMSKSVVGRKQLEAKEKLKKEF